MTAATQVATSLDRRELLRAMRPRQWPKNLLVFAAPMAAGALGRPATLGLSVVAFAAFTAAAAGGYLLNDVCDLRADRLHPDKRFRPLAAGRISVRTAVVGGIVCVSVGTAIAAVTDDELLTIVVTYSLITLAYAYGLKRIPGVEVVIVASGFVLRPLAGSFATGVAPSTWFLAVCCLSALAITVGKRLVELVRLGSAAVGHRAALRHYSVAALSCIQMSAVALMAIAYVGWALTRRTHDARMIDLFSLLPVLVAFARLFVLNAGGEGGAPEQLLLSDRFLQAMAVLWVVLFAAGVAHG
jgi:decaprenyl-phosphate phosphoribosyltransferase